MEPVLVLREEPRRSGEHAVVPAERRKAEPEHHSPAGEDRDPLDEVGPHHRPQAAVDRVGARQQADAPDSEQGGGELRGAGREAEPAPEQLGQHEDGVQRHRAGVEHGRHRHEDRRSGQERGKDGPRAPVVAPLEELRHREDAALQVAGQQEPADDDQRRRGGPLVAGDREADVRRRRPGHPHEVLGGDVGGHERHPDGPPAEVPAGEEVPLGRAAPARSPQRYEDHRPQEQDEGDQVGRGERHGTVDCASDQTGTEGTPASGPSSRWGPAPLRAAQRANPSLGEAAEP